MLRIVPASQVCKTCKVEKPAGAFFKQLSKRSGLFAECKVCQRKRNQAWIDANRERFRHLNRTATNGKRRRDPVRSMLALARARCKKSGLEFALSLEDVVVPEFCPILGIKLTYGLGHGQGLSMAVRDSRASLDRIDNTKGYVPGNVVVISYRANRIKSDANVQELLRIARFYARLEAEKRGQNDLPRVQPETSEEAGEMPQRDEAA
jgi:hypothetical protein